MKKKAQLPVKVEQWFQSNWRWRRELLTKRQHKRGIWSRHRTLGTSQSLHVYLRPPTTPAQRRRPPEPGKLQNTREDIPQHGWQVPRRRHPTFSSDRRRPHRLVGGLRTDPGHLDPTTSSSTPPSAAHPATSTSCWPSALHRDPARAILRRVRVAALRDSPPSPKREDWWDDLEAENWTDS